MKRRQAIQTILGLPALTATGTLASSVNLLLPDAVATGKLTIVPNAVVREIAVDKNTGNANVVIVGASCLQSTCLLLNSKSPQHPNGLGNSMSTETHY